MPEIEVDRLKARMQLDKKERGKVILWVLLEEIRRPVIRDDVPMELVRDVLVQLMEER